MAKTMTFSIRLTNEEKNLAESYARLHAISMGEAFKTALFEKIQDEYDVAIANEVCDEYSKNPVTYSIDEVKDILKL